MVPQHIMETTTGNLHMVGMGWNALSTIQMTHIPMQPFTMAKLSENIIMAAHTQLVEMEYMASPKVEVGLHLSVYTNPIQILCLQDIRISGEQMK